MMGAINATRMVLRCAASADRKSKRLNSSHRCISYAVFCLKKKNAFGLPIKNIRQADDKTSNWPYFIGDLKHPKEKFWWQFLETYKSGFFLTSRSVPQLGPITDPVLLHF